MHSRDSANVSERTTASDGEMRLFVAILLPADVRASVAEQLLPPLRPLLPRASWVRPDNLHITVKFIGERERALVPKLVAALRDVTVASAPLALTLQGVGGFPSLERPRVVWLGADARGEGEAAMLARRVDDVCARLGIPRERRRFRAHVTLARVRDARASAGREAGAGELARVARRLTSRWPLLVTEIALMQSELAPGGSRYTAVERFPLGVPER